MGFSFAKGEAVTKVLAVIPARYASSRFPGKALADLAGVPLVVRVAEQATQMQTVDRVVVATDDSRVHTAVTQAGFECEMTGDHPTGTDRIGEVVQRYPADIVVNLQGDEPLLDPADADRLVVALESGGKFQAADLATLAHPFDDPRQWRDPNVVKVLVDLAGQALYFSRAAVPGAFPASGEEAAERGVQLALRHVGVYAFKADVLTRFLVLPRGPLEVAEGLEQLRALENGLRIGVVQIDNRPVGVDTAADLEEVRRRWLALYPKK